MAQGQGKSSFETGTNPLAVVCIQLAGSAGARPMELVGVEGGGGSAKLGHGGNNRDGWLLCPGAPSYSGNFIS